MSLVTSDPPLPPGAGRDHVPGGEAGPGVLGPHLRGQGRRVAGAAHHRGLAGHHPRHHHRHPPGHAHGLDTGESGGVKCNS